MKVANRINIKIELNLMGQTHIEVTRHSILENDLDELLNYSVKTLEEAGQKGTLTAYLVKFEQGDIVKYILHRKIDLI